MDSLQADIDTLGWAVDVQFLGVNEMDLWYGNMAIMSVSDLPWLQDIPEQHVWNSWDVTFRYVVILNQQNVPVSVFNVTTHNLAIPANFDSLKTLLGEFAGGGQ